MSTFSRLAAIRSGRSVTRANTRKIATLDGALLDIVLVSTHGDWSPAEQEGLTLGRDLRDRGHSVRVVALESTPFAQRMESDAFEVATMTSPRNPLEVVRLRRYLCVTSPDIVLFMDAGALRLGPWITWRIGGARRFASPFSIQERAHPTRFASHLDGVVGAPTQSEHSPFERYQRAMSCE